MGRGGSSDTFLLRLKDDGAPDVPDEFIFLPPPSDPAYTLRIAIEGTSSICRQGSLWINIPEPGKAFEKDAFREFRLRPDFQRDIEIDIPISCAGAFAYYVTFSPLPSFSAATAKAVDDTKTPLYYIDVSPNLELNGKHLPIKALSIFSVISKLMGKYPEDWRSHLKGISQRGYNMIHFTPLTQRGISNSPYAPHDQLKFDPELFPNDEKDISDLVSTMEKDYGLLGMIDVVWNHTSKDSKWLEEHPEAGYSVETAPWLESALELDDALLEFTTKLPKLGLPTNLSSLDDLHKVMDAAKTEVLDPLKLWQYYVVDVKANAKDAVAAWAHSNIDKSLAVELQGAHGWSLKQKADFLLDHGFVGKRELGSRFHRHIDPCAGAALLTAIHGASSSQASEETGNETMLHILDELNLPFYREFDGDMAEIKEQLFNRNKYLRLDDNGPKVGAINEDNPIIETYFTRLPLNATTEKHKKTALSLVNNGWIWGGDAMKDNAGPTSRSYVRREVIVWGDCVKLRYGLSPKDNPYLWERMTKYTKLMAKHFAAVRVDNCHSTPIHVAEYLLGQARQARPNLAIFAELFTGSEQTDYMFVKRLGLSALIREAMQSWSTQEMSRLVHRYGGRAIGSFEVDEITGTDDPAASSIKKIKKSPLHALFMDCTHDNEVPAQKRDARDTLPNAALVSVCDCATGSVMGYDEIYPALVDLVNEKRLYRSISSENDVSIGPGKGGIGGMKKLLNQIHVTMGTEEYDEAFIHHEGEFVTVHRVHPHNRKGYFLIAHTAYHGGDGNDHLSPVHLAGTKAKLLGAWQLKVDASEEAKKKSFDDKKCLVGLESEVVEIDGINIVEDGDSTRIEIPSKFPPGSIAIFETSIPSAEHSDGLDQYVTSGAREACANLSLVDLNFLLYRCDAEERDFTSGADGVYNIPGHGALVYAGLQGWWSVLQKVVNENNLGHPICNHLRDGQWSMDYIVGRLEKHSERGFKNLDNITQWLKQRFDALRKIPSFLLPRYFALVVQTAYNAAWDRGISLFSDDIKSGQRFLQQLAMVSIQQTGLTQSASLRPKEKIACLAAGLPHFSVEWGRCWGRDIFISARGLFLATGRFDDAKEHILAFGSVLKHGMIPNLLSSGELPRYNSRDSVWFFLQNIQDYAKMAPNGLDILKESTKRRFLPNDDTFFGADDPRAYSQSSTVEEIIQEAMQRHASGFCFEEANAGPGLDMQMKPEGFKIEVNVDWDTGIIFGGSQFNCGTWQDKMGESPRAGSKGVPGTPRDGAAIEITGLLYSTLVWLAELHEQGKYAHNCVKTSKGEEITFENWALKLRGSFERCYYIPKDPKEDSSYDVDSKLVNRRGIYKDLYKSGKPYEDYQLRSNFSIAMTVAPDLFHPENALGCIELADTTIRGPLGMATLDPSDKDYHPYYNNSEDSDNFATSKGRNYHQGPEWLWPTGYFLRAMLKFDLMRHDTPKDRVEAYQQVTQRLEGCKKAINESPWAGLPELTQKNGEHCHDSSPTQAWSAACLIDLFCDAKEYSIQPPTTPKTPIEKPFFS